MEKFSKILQTFFPTLFVLQSNEFFYSESNTKNINETPNFAEKNLFFIHNTSFKKIFHALLIMIWRKLKAINCHLTVKK